MTGYMGALAMMPYRCPTNDSKANFHLPMAELTREGENGAAVYAPALITPGLHSSTPDGEVKGGCGQQRAGKGIGAPREASGAPFDGVDLFTVFS